MKESLRILNLGEVSGSPTRSENDFLLVCRGLPRKMQTGSLCLGREIVVQPQIKCHTLTFEKLLF